jgi:hypothetical protein
VTSVVPADRPAALDRTAPPPLAAASASLSETLRVLRPLLGATPALTADEATLERSVPRSDHPLVAACVPIESPVSRPVAPSSEPLVAAFLDGVQRSRVVAYHDGTPLVFATVAAAIRERVDRRLSTWHEPLVRRQLLASRRALGESRWEQLLEAGVLVVDLDQDEANGELSAGLSLPDAEEWLAHPHALRARALAKVSLEREKLERNLAAHWCASESRWLWIDGGVAGNVVFDAAAPVFGVVKSHTTLYGSGTAVREVLALREGERSPAFLVGHRVRRAVASWYLRLRRATHADPLFGLVRVEVVPPPSLLEPPVTAAAMEEFTAQCDRLSSAILLERQPVSLPDPRWDTLAYGVHAVETYLKSLIGP